MIQVYSWRTLLKAAFYCLLLAVAGVSIASGGIVRIGTPLEPRSLDTHASLSLADFSVNQVAYEGLARLTYDMELVPWLAESWTAVDDTTWQVELRQGISFHSGTPFNAQTVKEHFDRMIDPTNPGIPASWVGPLDEVVVVSDYVVEFRLTRPYRPFMHHLAMPHNVITDAREALRLGDAYGVQPSGTGPFRITEWTRGTQIAFEANADYWGGVPKVDGVVFRFIPEASSRLVALEVGEIDVAVDIPFREMARVDATPGLSAIHGFQLFSYFWFANVKDPILSDVAVRRALLHAIDVDLIVETIYEERFARPLDAFLPQGVFGYMDAPSNYDPDRAEALLNGAGWQRNAQGFFAKDGQVLTLNVLVSAKTPREAEATEAIQSLLREFGIDLRIERIEEPLVTATVRDLAASTSNEIPPFQLIGWGAGIRTADASNGLEVYFTTGGPRNPSHYTNPAFDALLQEGMTSMDEEAARAAYQAAQGILMEDLPAIPLWQPTATAAIRDSVHGYALHATGLAFYEDLELRE